MLGAVSADKIVAQPGTLTGSIGVVRKGLNLAPALKKAGVDVDSVTVGKHALIHSSFKSRTRGEARMLDAWTDRLHLGTNACHRDCPGSPQTCLCASNQYLLYFSTSLHQMCTLQAAMLAHTHVIGLDLV